MISPMRADRESDMCRCASTFVVRPRRSLPYPRACPTRDVVGVGSAKSCSSHWSCSRPMRAAMAGDRHCQQATFSESMMDQA